MRDETSRDIIARLHRQEQELQALRRMVAPRRRARRSKVAAASALALFLALVPLSLLAANPFNDLTGGVHDANIDAIYSAGVTTGCVPNVSYCPTDNVTREEMASFLARLGGLGANPPVANAAKLNGVDASAYAQKGQFYGTEVLDVNGPLPKAHAFTSHGGILVVFTSGTGYFSAAGLLDIRLNITGPTNVPNATILQVFTNEANSHKAFPSEVEVLKNLPAGDYTFTLVEGASTSTNANDRFTISVIEIPKP